MKCKNASIFILLLPTIIGCQMLNKLNRKPQAAGFGGYCSNCLVEQLDKSVKEIKDTIREASPYIHKTGGAGPGRAGRGSFSYTDDLNILCHLKRTVNGKTEKSRWPLFIRGLKTKPDLLNPKSVSGKLKKIRESDNVYWILSSYGVGIKKDNSVHEKPKKWPVLFVYDANKNTLTQHMIYRYDENLDISPEDIYKIDGLSKLSFYGVPFINSNCLATQRTIIDQIGLDEEDEKFDKELNNRTFDWMFE